MKIEAEATYTKEAKPIGVGTYGVVYKGRWNTIDVAIKELKGDFTKECFDNELAIMRRLLQSRTENTKEQKERFWPIIAIYSAVINPPSIVMEFMLNKDLYHFLKRKDIPVEWPRKYQIALDVAYGVKYLHDQEILHRDLKSLNVLLNEEYRAKLCDFGLSIIKSTARRNLIQKQEEGRRGFGTSLWKAPELFSLDMEANNATDVYALGMVLYELLTHKIPFEDALKSHTPDEILGLVEMGQRPKLDMSIMERELMQTRQKIVQQRQRPQINNGPSEFIEELKKESLDNEYIDLTTLYKELIEQCWKQDPRERPSAITVVESLEKQIEYGDKIRNRLNCGNVTSSQLAQIPDVTATDSLYHVDPIELSSFLKQVSFGNQRAAMEMLERNKKLALVRGDLTDCAGREFKQITGFQYALWALDYYMWTMLKDYLEPIHQREQIMMLLAHKEYEVPLWVEKHGVQVTWLPLINALKSFHERWNEWSSESGISKEAFIFWCSKVGGAQLRLPSHVIQEYYGIVSINDSPWSSSFRGISSKESIARCHEGISEKVESIVTFLWRGGGESSLGVDFAWKKVPQENLPKKNPSPDEVNSICTDYNTSNALERLLAKRTQQRAELISSLFPPVTNYMEVSRDIKQLLFSSKSYDTPFMKLKIVEADEQRKSLLVALVKHFSINQTIRCGDKFYTVKYEEATQREKQKNDGLNGYITTINEKLNNKLMNIEQQGNKLSLSFSNTNGLNLTIALMTEAFKIALKDNPLRIITFVRGSFELIQKVLQYVAEQKIYIRFNLSENQLNFLNKEQQEIINKALEKQNNITETALEEKNIATLNETRIQKVIEKREALLPRYNYAYA